MTSSKFSLKKNSGKILERFYQLLEECDKGKIWESSELVKEINQVLMNKNCINRKQISWILRIQKRYKVFKNKGMIIEYIFIKKKNFVKRDK